MAQTGGVRGNGLSGKTVMNRLWGDTNEERMKQ